METRHIRWRIGWGYTSECNMRCKHCYSHRVRKKHQNFKDLALKDEKLRKSKSFVMRNINNIESINYGTGENVLDPHWWELLEYTNEKTSIPQGLTTNGSLYLYKRKRKIHKKVK